MSLGYGVVGCTTLLVLAAAFIGYWFLFTEMISTWSIENTAMFLSVTIGLLFGSRWCLKQEKFGQALRRYWREIGLNK